MEFPEDTDFRQYLIQQIKPWCQVPDSSFSGSSITTLPSVLCVTVPNLTLHTTTQNSGYSKPHGFMPHGWKSESLFDFFLNKKRKGKLIFFLQESPQNNS